MRLPAHGAAAEGRGHGRRRARRALAGGGGRRKKGVDPASLKEGIGVAGRCQGGRSSFLPHLASSLPLSPSLSLSLSLPLAPSLALSRPLAPSLALSCPLSPSLILRTTSLTTFPTSSYVGHPDLPSFTMPLPLPCPCPALALPLPVPCHALALPFPFCPALPQHGRMYALAGPCMRAT